MDIKVYDLKLAFVKRDYDFLEELLQEARKDSPDVTMDDVLKYIFYDGFLERRFEHYGK